jgi:hypothetical protein
MRLIHSNRLFLLSLFVGLICISCNTNQQSEDINPSQVQENQTLDKGTPNPFVDELEKAHAKNDFMSKDAVKFDLQLSFGGKERLKGSLTLLTNSSAGLIEYQDGRKLLYKEGQVYYTKEFNEKQASFAAYTWSYFFLLPYKISDPGTQLLETPYKDLQNKTYHSRKLVFDPETGASPDDWYILYNDQSTSLLRAAAYIVTAGKSAEEAEKDPHAIEYLNYQQIEGIPIANEWKFWAWRPDSGFTKQLGEARLSNIHFNSTRDLTFEPSEGMLELRSF